MTNRDEIESALIELRAIIEQHLNMLTLYGPQKPIVREYAREAIRRAGKCIAYLQGIGELKSTYSIYGSDALKRRIMNHAFDGIESDTNYMPDNADRGWFWDAEANDPDFSYADDWWKLPKRKTSAP
jgi:hypothetical protein